MRYIGVSVAQPTGPNMKTTLRILRTLFARHTWKQNADESRTCTTCNRREQYVFDHPASYWDIVDHGDRSKH